MIQIERGFYVKRKMDKGYGLTLNFAFNKERLIEISYTGEIKTWKRNNHGVNLIFSIC